ncbi:MAG: nuclear transport factor 2 family protein [Rubrivivax sp.]|nr:nuclear transport factor 2 family protein [Rubrivivax sp.]
MDRCASPARQRQAPRDEVISISFGGPGVAVAVVKCAVSPRHFIDVLALIHLPGPAHHQQGFSP